MPGDSGSGFMTSGGKAIGVLSTLGLAPLLVAQIFQTIADIADEGTSILLVEQNARMALGVADRAYLLDTGRIVREDSADAMAADESVQEVYLGG